MKTTKLAAMLLALAGPTTLLASDKTLEQELTEMLSSQDYVVEYSSYSSPRQPDMLKMTQEQTPNTSQQSVNQPSF